MNEPTSEMPVTSSESPSSPPAPTIPEEPLAKPTLPKKRKPKRDGLMGGWDLDDLM